MFYNYRADRTTVAYPSKGFLIKESPSNLFDNKHLAPLRSILLNVNRRFSWSVAGFLRAVHIRSWGCNYLI